MQNNPVITKAPIITGTKPLNPEPVEPDTPPQQPNQNQQLPTSLGASILNTPMFPIGPMLNGLFGQTAPVAEDSDVRKVFIKNIPEDLPDSFLEQILKECGNLVNWKRSTNAKNIPNSFGYGEFETIEAVLRCLRLVHNTEVLGKVLQVNSSNRAQEYIKRWREEKLKELTNKNPGNIDLDAFLKQDDERPRKKIDELVKHLEREDLKQAKIKENEKKDLPRERERQNKKKQMKADLTKKYEDKLQEWLKREEQKAKERRKEKEREKEKERDKKKYIERELIYDSDEERKNFKNSKNLLEKKKIREKEYEEDELEKKKELLALIPKPPEECIPQPEEEAANAMNGVDINKMEEEITKVPLPEPPKPNLASRSRLKFTEINPEEKINNTNNEIKMSIELPKAKVNVSGSAFGNVPMEVEAEPKEEKIEPKPAIKLPEKKLNDYLEKKGIAHLNPTLHSTTKVEQVPVPQVVDQRELLERLLKQLPNSEEEAFNYQINWGLLQDHHVHEKKILPWVEKKTRELLGTEEETFIQLIMKKIASKDRPEDIVKKVQNVIDDAAEDFVYKLWRMIIFEQLKIEHKLFQNIKYIFRVLIEATHTHELLLSLF